VWSWVRSFGEFWYGFIIGDDWTVALAVGVAVAATWGLVQAGVVAWWPLPLVIVLIVGLSIRRLERREDRSGQQPG
jgi:hypothetical protein